jgi:undecaprenyl diphosphate synthase
MATGSSQEKPAPRHLAIIMDGNGRWAKARGLDRSQGHRAGADNILRIAEACKARSIGTLSLFAFSTENWSRPKSEIDALMGIATDQFKGGFASFPGLGISLSVIGDLQRLPKALQTMIRQAERANPKEYSLKLLMAVNYGGRWDIAKAASELAEECVAGRLKTSDITQETLEGKLSTKGQPPVDLLIRTGGEKRISNFLIWQSAYSELYFSEKHWPDFDEAELDRALEEYSGRNRRFGGL